MKMKGRVYGLIIRPICMQAVRRNVRGLPIDVAALNAFLARRRGRVFLSDPYPPQVRYVYDS